MIRPPYQWTALLHRFHEAGFPDAVIAGGALRDLDHGKEVKDIDIFVAGGPGDKQRVDAIMGFKGRVLIGPKFSAYKAGLQDVYFSVEYAPENDPATVDTFGPLLPPVQVIGLRDLPTDPKSVMSRMDFGLCQIAWDGRTLHTTAAYHIDKDARAFVVRDCANADRFVHSYQRFERLVKKYPGYTFDPNGFDKDNETFGLGFEHYA